MHGFVELSALFSNYDESVAFKFSDGAANTCMFSGSYCPVCTTGDNL